MLTGATGVPGARPGDNDTDVRRRPTVPDKKLVDADVQSQIPIGVAMGDVCVCKVHARVLVCHTRRLCGGSALVGCIE
jgi:hypothetical protein